MSILKSILLTILLISIFLLTQLGFWLFSKIDIFDINLRNHLNLFIDFSFILSYLTVFYFYWKPKPNFKKALEFKNYDLNILFYLIIILIGYEFISHPFWEFSKILKYYQFNEFEPYNSEPIKITFNFIYRTVAVLIISPLFEELFFRKFLLGKLLKKNKIKVAIITSSLCFSLIHLETPNNLIPTFIFGIISSIIYIKTKNIGYSVIFHFINNLMSIIFSIYGMTSFYKWMYELKFDFMYWSLFVFGILVTIAGIKKIISIKAP